MHSCDSDDSCTTSAFVGHANEKRFIACLMYSCRVVVQIGDGVQNVQVGDHVALEPGSPCWLSNAARCHMHCGLVP